MSGYRIPSMTFRIKLTLAITIMTTVFVTLGMVTFYSYSRKIMIARMGKNLIDVGRLGVTLFDRECRQAIVRLTLESEKEMQLLPDEILAIPTGEYRRSLSPQMEDRLQAGDDFQMLYGILITIGLSSLKDIVPGLNDVDPDKIMHYYNEGVIGPYIVVAVNESPDNTVIKYLVSSGYAPSEDGWPGNPIGNIGHNMHSLKEAFSGQSIVLDHIEPDAFYSSLNAAVPIMDEEGRAIALLGLDFSPGKELNKLRWLTWASGAIIVAGAFFSLFVSWIISKKMSASLHHLRDAALKIRDGNRDIRTDIRSNDEFGDLGRVFNEMVETTRDTSRNLEANNRRLRSVAANMHDGVSAVLITMHAALQQKSSRNLDRIETLARDGLDELCFFQGVMEQDRIGIGMLREEIGHLAENTLGVKDIDWEIVHDGDNRIELSMTCYMDIRRMVREALTNIIKHSTATFCRIGLSWANGNMNLSVSDNGQPVSGAGFPSGGRGLEHMAYRAGRYQGSIAHRQTKSGFYLDIDLTVPE